MTGSRTLLAIPLALMVATIPAAGQGRSGSAKGKKATSSGIPSPSTTVTSTPSNSANSIIYYGSWLDDASIVPKGGAWVGLSSGYWKGQGLRQIDAPVVSVVSGLSDRIQIGGSIPFYHFHDDAGVSESGIGNISVYGKAMLIDPETSPDRVGFAIAPLLEMSSGATDRFGWALPINLEVRRERARFYGSAGYFSRGSVFGSIAADLPAGNRVTITGNAARSYAQSGSHQTSVGISAGVSVSGTSSVFVGLGQTFQAVGAGPGGLSLAGGASFLIRKF